MRLQRFFPLGLILIIIGINGSFYSQASASTLLPIANPTPIHRSGQLFVMQGDPGPGQHLPHQTAYSIKDVQGNVTRLTFTSNSPVPPISASGKWINLTGNVLATVPQNGAVQGSKTELLQVQSYQFTTAPTGAASTAAISPQSAVSGPQAWVNILCRFADNTYTSRDPSYVDALMGKMNHYWNEQSYGQISISGSQVYGWFTLPSPRSVYFIGSSFDLDKAAQDCTGAADSTVYFPNFVGVNLMFNDVLDCCSWGGATSLSLDGGPRSYRVTWLPPWGYENQGVVAHEMGHGLGLPHSSGPYGQTYDSGWDVMSDLWFNCPPYDADFGCIAVGTISEHKNMLDWIPPQRKYTVDVGTSSTITLERLDLPVSTTNYLMAIIPINGSSSHFYTVEARKFAGYDSNLPFEGVVIHDVDLSGAHLNPANVVDGDNNGVTTDAGSAWTVGETYTDAANRIQVQVIGSDTSSFTVTLSNGNVAGSTPTFSPPTVVLFNTTTSTPTPILNTSLKVQYHPTDTFATDNAIKPQFNIVNTGNTSVTLNELELRYWFTRDTTQSSTITLAVNCDYAQITCTKTNGTTVAYSAVNGADYYLSVKFNAGTDTLAAGQDTGTINFRINKSDWSNFDETNDYSYDGTLTNFVDWNKVGLYRNGILVWGNEPPSNPVTPTTAATATDTATNTNIPTLLPTLTATATHELSTATSTATLTNTSIPPTNTPLPPTATFAPPTNTPFVPTSTPPSTATSFACRVTYSVYSDWDSGVVGKRGFSANVVITNTGTLPINTWTLAWNFGGDQVIGNLWNATYSQTGQAVTANGPNTGIIYPSGSLTFGFNATYSGTNANPTVFSLNGTPCN